MSGAGRHCVRTLWQRVVTAVPRLGFCTACIPALVTINHKEAVRMGDPLVH